MFDINKFKSNSYYIIPNIVQNVDLFYKNTLKEVELKKIGLNTYLDVVYNNSDKKETSSIINMLYFEKNLYNTYEDVYNNDIVFVVRFLVPKSYDTFCNIISKSGESFLSVKDLKNTFKYWKWSL